MAAQNSNRSLKEKRLRNKEDHSKNENLKRWEDQE
jgi:hypothetical protein